LEEMTVAGAGGIKLRCATHGERDLPAVILLHGLGRDGDDWAAVGEALRDEHWVLAPDQRGHGKSDHADEYSFEAMAEDVVALIDDVGLQSTAVVGHSMGGSVAFDFVEKHPERVTRLVIEDTPPPRVGWDVPMPPDDEPPGVTFHWPLAHALTAQLNNADPRWWNDLSKIEVPTLIVGGGSTSHVDPKELEEVAGLIPNSDLVVFEGAGHAVHLTRFDDFMGVVAPFLRGRGIEPR
jgi:pimeloyl-ACP methyl ester carboxylesterase